MHQESDAFNRRSSDIKPVRMLEIEPIIEGLFGVIAWPQGMLDIRDCNVVDSNNNTEATVNDLLVSTIDGAPVFTSVTLARSLGSKMKLIPMSLLEVKDQDHRVIYHGSADDLKNSPDYNPNTRVFDQFYDFWSSKIEVAPTPKTKEEAPSERELVAGRKGGEMGTGQKTEETERRDEGMKAEHKHEESEAGRIGGERKDCEGVDLNKKQSIEDISCGEIKKKD